MANGLICANRVPSWARWQELLLCMRKVFMTVMATDLGSITASQPWLFNGWVHLFCPF